MRVGKAFSAVLDPSKPALFSDLGDTDLTAAEAWHPSCIASIKLTAKSQGTDVPPPSEQYVSLNLLSSDWCTNRLQLFCWQTFSCVYSCWVPSCVYIAFCLPSSVTSHLVYIQKP